MNRKLYLLIFVFFASISFSCCNKEEDGYLDEFLGNWEPPRIERNMTYCGYINQQTTVMRIFSYNEKGNNLNVIMYQCPFKQVDVKIENGSALYDDFFVESDSTSTSCPRTKIVYHNIVGKISNDTLKETGNYDIYINNEFISGGDDNKYRAEFIKKKFNI